MPAKKTDASERRIVGMMRCGCLMVTRYRGSVVVAVELPHKPVLFGCSRWPGMTISVHLTSHRGM